jgi:hypothetical protein
MAQVVQHMQTRGYGFNPQYSRKTKAVMDVNKILGNIHYTKGT